MLSPNEKTSIQGYYAARAARFSESAQRCGWISTFTQTLRFQAITIGGDLSSARLLDVGCGTADLLGFLQETYESVTYTGLDFLPSFIATAQTTYPGSEFIEADFFDYPLPENPYDYVFSVGAFNHRTQDNEATLRLVLRKMFEMAKVGVGVSLLSDLSPPELKRAKELFYYTPSRVLEIAMEITPFVELKTHYLPNDMTLMLYR